MRATTCQTGTATRVVVLASLAAGLLLAPVQSRAEDHGAHPSKAVVVRGRLRARKAEGGTREFYVEVGDRTWRITGGEEVIARLGKLENHYAKARGRPSATGENKVMRLIVEKAGHVTVEDREPVEGTVRGRKGADSGRRELFLAAHEREIAIERRDASRFEKFVGLNVAARGYLVSDDRVVILARVRSVERKLLPGERDPRRIEDAVAGSWKGVFTAVEVPAGVPGKAGDYPVTLAIRPKDLPKCGGRFLGTYDVVGLRVRKSDMRKRTVEFELDYDYGSGHASVQCEGTFSADWKRLTGTWKSSHVGKGTFRVQWEAAAKGGPPAEEKR